MTAKEEKNQLFSRRNHQPVCGDRICGFVGNATISSYNHVAVFRSTDRRRKGPDEKICRAQEKVSSNKPTIDPRKATEQARTLALSGSLSIFRKENKKSGFKAPLHREPKNKKSKSVGSSDHSQDQEDAGAMSSSHDTEDREEEPELDMEQDTDQDSNRDGGSHRDQEEERSGDGDRDQDGNHDGDRDTTVRSSGLYLCCQGKQKGNTVYVGGSVLEEDSLRAAFSQHGNIIQLRMDNIRSGAFITFDKIESADQAVAKLHGSTLGNVSITAGIARRQPMLDAATDKSMWLTSSSAGEQTSTTGSHN
ncbi:negative elongation factor E-like isoform X1 [Solea solea]|uniref:negative elongation factor E-like isoform X1 n=1 Tax=Solea solea TaxID=90069 RepID=UPI00272B5C2F|nr:negative elongation factor E-like isoform X1 [Solea solea]XP_058474977.1 negative elongation factor E-like isoform X1 [Solea solea]XP_058474978.1 negative elongation factor E-like isoform X1 [Solea solea]